MKGLTMSGIEDLEISVGADGSIVTNHGEAQCAGHHCPVHNPSSHPMREWPYTFRFDLSVVTMIVPEKPTLEAIAAGPLNGAVFTRTDRKCPHDVSHPDPDSLAYASYLGGRVLRAVQEVHDCDGCCKA